ncbi:MAG: hypothetical protein NUV77_03035, partial [Thermoguttaceae bacterium]|nr:hypothetical protein [Thermoguttaceae bacterium]
MCGITGAVWTEPDKALDAPALRRMVESLRHRGPDDEGLWVTELQTRPVYGATPGVALGHRRLAVIDVAGGRRRHQGAIPRLGGLAIFGGFMVATLLTLPYP